MILADIITQLQDFKYNNVIVILPIRRDIKLQYIGILQIQPTDEIKYIVGCGEVHIIFTPNDIDDIDITYGVKITLKDSEIQELCENNL